MAVKRTVLAFLAGTSLFVMSAQAQAQLKIAPGTPIAAPDQITAIPLDGRQGKVDAEQWEIKDTRRIVRNVTIASITPVLPSPDHATGAAVIIAPGGGFLGLSMDSEGFDVARWLATRGIAAFVLKYRLTPTPRSTEGYAAAVTKRVNEIAQAKGVRDAMLAPPEALEDGKRAVRLVRARAREWHINPRRIGFLGFSAGAELTLEVALNSDLTARPDFVGVIYGPMTAVPVPPDAPPMFNALAADDPLFGNSDLGVIRSWMTAGRPVEFHMYEKGYHGFGMTPKGTSSDLWIDQFHAWLETRGLLRSSAPK